ncbi:MULTISPECIES: CU044_5270 family protein [Actinomadura]|uniref:CU044_5270 family protein n=1 Tax=Actinomadura yumaensis TaxID=111807 RepID=A0ABW2CGU0_9ACTN|nr:CU044_5270 family protein [Actinomadura sp. J1-007]MWK34628.1 hypothetical protein [Actinomadura sp. J1-007]
MNETDELAEVRALFDEPPAASPQVVTAARARLTEDGAPRRRGARRRAPRFVAAGFGLAAAATAAAITVVVAGQGDANDPNGRRSAHALLLMAAQQAESAPPGGGKYWHHTMRTDELVQVGKPGHAAYQVYARWRHEVWMPSDGSGPALGKSQELGAVPATEADRNAWRKEGSPATFRGTEGGSAISSKPGKPGVDRTKPADYEQLFGQSLTPQDVQALPTDPGRLKSALLRLIQRQSPEDGDEQLFDWGSSVLLHYPASPKVRAATYRMLADLPGVRKLGTVKDREGRTGTAVGIDIGKDDQGSTFGDRLIIDPASGRALTSETVMTGKGERAPSTAGVKQVNLSNATLRSDWTDKAPSR